MIKTVLIDVDDTLLDFHKGAKEAMKQGFCEAGLIYKCGMFDTFSRINEGLWRDIETKEITREELFKTRWKKVFEALSIDFDGPTFEEIFLRKLRESSVLVDYAKELMEYLHKKYTVCVASNAPHEQQIKRMENVGLTPFIDHVFTSERFGYEKPSRNFFDSCFKVLKDAKPSETIIIGDSVTADILGGLEYGIMTCWFNYRNKPSQGITPHYTVKNLKEITKIL